MATRPHTSNDFVSGNDVDDAVEEYVAFIINMPEWKTHSHEFCCLDQHRNQVQGCRCIFDLHNLKNLDNEDDLFSYHLICTEIALWFSAAKETEIIRSQPDTWMSQVMFNKLFHKTMILKAHRATGVFTKMVDMSNIPWMSPVSLEERSDIEDELRYVPTNNNITLSAFCLNTVLGIWKLLVLNKGWDLEKWQKISYQTILYQGARNQIDFSTQLKRQKLFYSRIGDFLAADTKHSRIPFTRAAKCYQATKDLENTAVAVQYWRQLNWYNWRNWQLQSIHVLVANSKFNYNLLTQQFFADHNMAITLVANDTISVLHKLMSELWRKRKNQPWKKVAQDRELWYMPFPPSHNFLSAIDSRFQKYGGYRATGELHDLIHGERERNDIACADDDIKEAILRELQSKLNTSSSRSVSFQPSFMMSQVHKPQEPHFDYRWDTKDRRGEFANNQIRFWIGFLPLTDSGQFMQFWKYDPNIQEEIKGEIAFIPKGHLLIVPGNTLHGGGFRAETRSGNKGAHARVHFYIYPGHETCPMTQHSNEYFDPYSRDRSIRLSKQYKNSDLLEGVLSGGKWGDSMNWNFFEGECPIDKETGVELKHRVPRCTGGRLKD